MYSTHHISHQDHRRNNCRDRGDYVLVPQLLGRSFQKARHFTANSHRNAGLSIWVFKNFPEVIPRNPQSGRGRPPSCTKHPARPLAGRGVQAPRCWDPNLGSPQLVSRGCASDQDRRLYMHLHMLSNATPLRCSGGVGWLIEKPFGLCVVGQLNINISTVECCNNQLYYPSTTQVSLGAIVEM